MKKSKKITVVSTKRDAAKGRKNIDSGDECPLGLALNRALKREGIKGRGEIDWGGTIQVNGMEFRPTGLKGMPFDRYVYGAVKYVMTPRRFSFTMPASR